MYQVHFYLNGMKKLKVLNFIQADFDSAHKK
jgi:hypothetical protein